MLTSWIVKEAGVQQCTFCFLYIDNFPDETDGKFPTNLLTLEWLKRDKVYRRDVPPRPNSR
jgi:hypothetical protein